MEVCNEEKYVCSEKPTMVRHIGGDDDQQEGTPEVQMANVWEGEGGGGGGETMGQSGPGGGDEDDDIRVVRVIGSPEDDDEEEDEDAPQQYKVPKRTVEEILPDGSKFVTVPAVPKESCPSAQEMNAKLAEVGDGAEFAQVPTSDLAYVLSESWLSKLSHFLTTEDLDFHPGPIDNSDLFEDNKLRELANLSKRGDYKLLSEQQWKLLVSWFGGTFPLLG